MKLTDFAILGVGAWGSVFRNWNDLSAMLNGQVIEDDAAKGPKPEVIPANERRRAPLPVRLAVEASWQATQHAGLDPKDLSCVFVSGLGDTQLTDYMCKVLAGDNKALSPTKFHNSVHNAAAGYWTISTGCMQAANSVAGYAESVPLTLMEALIQAQSEQRPILLTFYDAPVSAVLKSLLKNDQAFAISMIIAPTTWLDSGSNKRIFEAKVTQTVSQWPDSLSVDQQSELNQAYANNPVARILPLLALYNGNADTELSMPLSAQTSLTICRKSA